MAKKKADSSITVSSTAEYFSKNLQQVGFSSPTKAVLTTLKEAVDNSLDACEENGILPELKVVVKKLGAGSLRNTDQIMISVEDNGPGIASRDLPKVFGEYLASSKFGKGRCSRGQQGIGISAATTWAMQTTATGVKVISKTAKQRKAISCRIQVDLKSNKGHLKDKEEIDWNRAHGTYVEFLIDGRVQLNGESGLLAFLRSNVLVNPHMTLTYQLMDEAEVVEPRVSDEVPRIPEATNPHPHTMKLGEFLAHARLFGDKNIKEWLIKGFSRINEGTLRELKELGTPPKVLAGSLKLMSEKDFKQLFVSLQTCRLLPPSTRSVLSIGEEGLAKSIQRLGNIDYFSVVTRKPTICDFKPVQIEVAIARLEDRSSGLDYDAPVQVLRFANRVPLQFDKAGCAIVKGITTVNWKSYGLRQSRSALPIGPYIIAVSLVSPFIKFKNASKETIDASDELVEELRRALMQAGQRLSRHLRKEHKEAVLESKLAHIEQFAPILVDGLVRITESGDDRRDRAHQGLLKILGRETKEAKQELVQAETQLKQHIKRQVKKIGEAAIAGLDQSINEDIPELQESFERHAKRSKRRLKLVQAETEGDGKSLTNASKNSVEKSKKKAAGDKASKGKKKAAAKKASSQSKAKFKKKSTVKTKKKSTAKTKKKTIAKTKKKTIAKTKKKTTAKTKKKSTAKTKKKTTAKTKKKVVSKSAGKKKAGSKIQSKIPLNKKSASKKSAKSKTTVKKKAAKKAKAAKKNKAKKSR